MAFDPQQFMNTPADPLPVSYEVIPEGEYQMLLDSDPKMLEVRKIEGVSSKSGDPYLFYQLELSCLVLDEKVKAKLGRDKVTARMRINLDFDGDGKLTNGPNRNVALGQLRDALGQNKPGWTPAQLLGAGPFIGRVKHSSSKTNPEQKFAEVVKAGKIT